jgi:hypothetical protein
MSDRISQQALFEGGGGMHEKTIQRQHVSDGDLQIIGMDDAVAKDHLLNEDPRIFTGVSSGEETPESIRQATHYQLEQSIKKGDQVMIIVTGETIERKAEMVDEERDVIVCELNDRHPRLKLLDAPAWIQLTLKFGDYTIIRKL